MILPSEYQQVEHLESTGTQYIDTGIYPQLSDSFYIRFRFVSGPDDRIFGVYIPGVAVDGYTGLRIWLDKSYQSFGKTFKDGNVHTISCSESGTWYFDGDIILENHPVTAQSRFTIPLFKMRYSNGTLYGDDEVLQILDFQYFRNGSAIRFMTPCYRKSDDKPGMYDLVTGELLTNAGSGEFTVGPDVIDSISPWLVARRRVLMKEPELYPVGTNIRSLYNAVFISGHGIDTSTGEYVENSSRQASPVYMPISPKYTYWKRGTFPNRAYLSVLAFYDKDKNYISYYGKNDYGDFVIPDIPANARYARIAIPSGSYNDVKIIRTA